MATGRGRAARCGQADVKASAGGERDKNRGGDVEVQKVADLNVELNGDTGNEGKRLLGRDRALLIIVDGNQRGGVVEQADPDSNLSTSADVKTKDVQAGLDADSAAQAQTKGEVNSDIELNVGTEADGESLGDKTLTVTL